jgi:hypothetical protein
MGVSALKLKGRMKNAAYVVSAVKRIRAVMDGKTYDPLCSRQFSAETDSQKAILRPHSGKKCLERAGKNHTGRLRIQPELWTRIKSNHTDCYALCGTDREPLSLFVTDCDGNTVSVQGAVCEAAHKNPSQRMKSKTQLKNSFHGIHGRTLIGHATEICSCHYPKSITCAEKRARL